MKWFVFRSVVVGMFVSALSASAATVVSEHNDNDEASAAFRFKSVRRPVTDGLARNATFTIIDGEMDPNAGGLDKLHDGKLPHDEDQPSENFFFSPGTAGGRLLIDLGARREIARVNTYSWHPGSRGPQVYTLYASDGTEPGYASSPKRGVDPTSCGWTLLARVDTRPKDDDEAGGQHGVSLSDPEGLPGNFRYLLFDISQTENDDAFGNTFYSEIDVVGKGATEAPEPPVQEKAIIIKRFEAGSGKYHLTLNTTDAPDLTDWACRKMVPAFQEWYPKLVNLLPSDKYQAPSRLSIIFTTEMPGVPAAASGKRVRCNAEWFRGNLDGEALGSVIHELVHVIQSYDRAPRRAGGRPAPGWLVEGIADYVRWYKFEPESHGAEISRQNLSRARYSSSYRITANFLNWVSENFDHDLVQVLNAALRQGAYQEQIWKERTGKSLQELGEAWKAALVKAVEAKEKAATLPSQP